MSAGTPGKRKGASDAAKLKAAKGVLDFNALVVPSAGRI